MISSPPQNFRQRSVIRSTWLKDLVQDPHIRAAFLLGRYSADTRIPYNSPPSVDEEGNIISEEDIEEEVFEEGKKHGDIILEEFVDTYLNLTLKTSFMFKWLYNKCPKTEVVFKVDDDIYVNHHNLITLMYSFSYFSKEITYQDENDMNITENIDYAFIGHTWHQAYANRNRNTKYFLPMEFYSKPELPTFLRGLAWMFTGSLIAPLWACIVRSNYIPGEDVFVTGLCATEQLGLRLTHHNGFCRYPIPSDNDGMCYIKELVAVHGFELEDYENIFYTIENTNLCPNPNSLIEHSKPGTYC